MFLGINDIVQLGQVDILGCRDEAMLPKVPSGALLSEEVVYSMVLGKLEILQCRGCFRCVLMNGMRFYNVHFVRMLILNYALYQIDRRFLFFP